MSNVVKTRFNLAREDASWTVECDQTRVAEERTRSECILSTQSVSSVVSMSLEYKQYWKYEHDLLVDVTSTCHLES